MSDVFISYARSTAQQANAAADALRDAGYSVWLDAELNAHRAYTHVIEEQLAAARAALVIWSADATRSEWVLSEANRAREEGKLVQLTLDGARLPMPFDQTQCANLTGWTGAADSPGWRKVLTSIAEIVGAPEAAGLVPKSTSSRGAAARPKPTICVLPFANLSGDPEQEYFSDGISEDIITDLSKVSALAVIARNTAFAFRGRSVRMPDLARELGVTHLLEGSVRKAGPRVRITTQLVDGATSQHLWGERFDRDLTDIFAVQDEISEAIVGALKLKLLPGEKSAIERRGTKSAQAYDLYLMARRHAVGQAGKRYDLIIRLSRGALDLDPDYAEPWALIAVIEAAKSAYSMDAADIAWDAAERALSLNPNLAEAWAAKARILLRRGQNEESQAAIERALALDSSSRDVNVSAGLLAVSNKDYETAIARFEAVCVADETDVGAPMMILQCREALGDPAAVRTAARLTVERVESASAAEPDNGALLGFGVGALVLLGETARAKTWAERALRLDPDDTLLRYNLACGMVRAGETDYALTLLEESLRAGGRGHYVWTQSDNDLDPLRDLPRFKAIMADAEARFAKG